MRRIVAIAVFWLALLFAGTASAQNCSGQPPANTVCAGPTGGGNGPPSFRLLVGSDLPSTTPITTTGITINPAAGSLNRGITINQTAAGTWPAGPAALNWINITADNTDKSSADAFTNFGLYLFHATGGSGAKGSVNSLFVHQNVLADATTNASGHRDYVGIGSQVDTNAVFPIQGGGGAAGASIGAAGSGYTNGAQVLTLAGGTCSVQPSFNVTVAGNVVTSVNSVNAAGTCTVPPANPAATTGGGGTGATLNATYSNPVVATLFGYAATVAAGAGTTNLAGMVGAEIDVQPNVAGINYLVGWNVALQGSKQAFIRSVAYEVSATGTSPGWLYALGVTTQSGGAGLATAGTVVSVLEAMNLAKGIDFTNATFSGNAWTSAGASITAAGAANFKQTVSVTGTTTDGYVVTDSTVTGTFASSALHTNSIAVGTSSAHDVVFISNNTERGAIASGGGWTWTVAQTIASATAANWRNLYLSPATTTITGNTGSPITRMSAVTLDTQTLTDASAVTVTDAATLHINAAPVAAGSVTITNPWSVLVGAGNAKFGGNVLINSTVGLAPDTPLTVNANTGATVAPVAGTNVHVVGADSTINVFTLDAFTGINFLGARRANGTLAAKTALAANDVIFQFSMQGWDGSAFGNSAGLLVAAGEIYSGTAHGSYVRFNTVALTTTTVIEAGRFAPSGGLTVGSTTDPGNGFVSASKALQSAVLTVATLPTCNAGSEGARAYVSDQNTAVAYRGAVTGAGATRQAVLCSNSTWIQD